MYRTLDLASVPAKARKAAIADARGGDSVYTLFLAVDIDPSYFSDIAGAHCFYTPRRTAWTGPAAGST